VRYVSLCGLFCEFSATERALYTIIHVLTCFLSRIEIGSSPSSFVGVDRANSLSEHHTLLLPLRNLLWGSPCSSTSAFVSRGASRSLGSPLTYRSLWFIVGSTTAAVRVFLDTFSSRIGSFPLFGHIKSCSFRLKHFDADLAVSL
jgi:hypothetical protein